ncbi:hypothetical protein D3C76_1271320 [compost metagenome]
MAGQPGRQRAIELKWRRHVHPVEQLELGELRRRLAGLWFKRRGIVDDQRQIVMGAERPDQPLDLRCLRKVRPHQLHPQGPQMGQLGAFAAITARHLPTRSHQLLAQVETQSAATARHQCTHCLSLCH